MAGKQRSRLLRLLADSAGRVARLIKYGGNKEYFYINIFPGSSAVERRPVKADVAGSNPASGAK